jgi:hypothetical protein
VLSNEYSILGNWAVFEVFDLCGKGSSTFLITKHLVLWCNEISSTEKPRTLTYRGKKLIGKNVYLGVIENKSCRTSVYEET